MTAKKSKRKHSEITQATRLNKHREVRDIYNKLRKKYQLDVLYGFFRTNFFLQPEGIDHIISRVDNVPVDPARASIIYHTVMSESFHL